MNVLELKKEVNFRMNQLHEAAESTPIEDPNTYADWLAQTHFFVCHSTRLLALASSRFPLDQNDYHYRYAEHIGEEKGHEIIALNDLKALGFKIDDFIEYSSTKAFYQTQYYQIEHVSPAAFWGYVLCLEAFAVQGGVRIYERAKNAHGGKSTVFLKIHVQEDISHVDKAYQALEGIDSKELSMIFENLKLSCDLYADIYQQIRTSQKSSLIAA